MKKSKLLKTAPLKATAGMLEMAGADAGEIRQIIGTYYRNRYTHYNTRLYFRARKLDEILEVDLYTRASLAGGDSEPLFRIFLDKKNDDFVTYVCEEERWSNAKLDMLSYNDHHVTYTEKPPEQSSDRDRKLVNTYLATGYNFSIERAVLKFQLDVRGGQLNKKHKLMTDEIDENMAMVPELPKDFDDWISKTGCYEIHYLFYQKDKKCGFCDCCGKQVEITKHRELVKHNAEGCCENCGNKVTYKSWNRQQNVKSKTSVGILQKCSDGEHLAFRQFDVYKENRKEKAYMPEIHRYEKFRTILDKKMFSVNEYEYGEFKNTGIRRWCYYGSVNHGGYHNYYYCRSTSSLYHKNLTTVLKDTELNYMPMKDLVLLHPGKRFEVERQLRNIYLHKEMYEALFKAGLKEFVYEHALCVKNLTRINYDGRKLWDKLHITRPTFKQAVELNATDKQLRIIQRACSQGIAFTNEQILWIDRYLGVHTLIGYFAVHTPHRMMRYLKEKLAVEEHDNNEQNEMLRLYTDYLETARQLEWNLRDRQIFFPQNVHTAHDEAAALLLAREDEKEALQKREKDKIMQSNAKDIKEVFDYEDDAFTIKVPEKYTDFKHEGHSQHNCVATYYDEAVDKKTIILFIRKKTEPDKSFCTVEIGNRSGEFTILQNRIVNNAEAPEEAKQFMDKAVASAQKKWNELYMKKIKNKKVTVAV